MKALRKIIGRGGAKVSNPLIKMEHTRLTKTDDGRLIHRL
jgi:hypothetical protein